MVKRTYLLCAFVTLFLSPSWAAEPIAQTQPNAKLAAIPENTWEKVAPFNAAGSGILAYSGGVYDSVNHQVLNFGGGHADYGGNEVIAFSPATLTWKRMYEPDASGRYLHPEDADLANGKFKDSDKPFTRHSYNRLCFVTSTASLFVSGGCGPGLSGMKAPFYCNALGDAWSYSYKDNKWTMLNSKDVPVCSHCGLSYCYDSKRDAVWGYTVGKLYRFDPKAKTWSQNAVKGKDGAKFDNGGYPHAKYLAKPDRILVISGVGTTDKVRSFTINLDTFEAESHPSENVNPAGGLAYLSDQDVALYVALSPPGVASNYQCAVFDCASKTWHQWETANMPANAKKLGTEGEVSTWDNLHYDPVDKVALLVNGTGVWAYKPPKKFEFTAGKKATSAPEGGEKGR